MPMLMPVLMPVLLPLSIPLSLLLEQLSNNHLFDNAQRLSGLISLHHTPAVLTPRPPVPCAVYPLCPL